MLEGKVVGIQEVVKAAEECFGNPTKAVNWLTEPKRMLGGDTPLKHACTVVGAQKVLGVIVNIDHGFSF